MTRLLHFIRANRDDLTLFGLVPAIALLAIFGSMNGNTSPDMWAAIWESL